MSYEIAGIANEPAPLQTMTGPSATAPVRQKMSSLFDQIDSAGTGSIDAAQFAAAFAAGNPPAGFQALGAGAVFARLDARGTGSVSRSEFISGMTALSVGLRGAATGDGDGDGDKSPATGTGGAIVNTTA
jgi:hypothetical protein